MNFKGIMKAISIIVALAGVAVAIYFAIQKLTGTKEAEYFDDNEFFECDNDLEIVEADNEETVVEDEKKEAAPKKSAPKKKAAAKNTKSSKAKASK